jgi:DNA recombination protein RmuC
VDPTLSSLLIGALLALVVLGVLLAVALARLRTLMQRTDDGADLKTRLEGLSAQNERLERELRADLAQARGENAHAASATRGELTASLTHFTQTLQNQLAASAGVQNERLATLTQSNDQRLEAVRASVEQRLEALRTDNAQKLEQMRATVDERLQATLEQRLGESFKLVSDRLDQVHKGLGEMHTLAAGVGDLKRVLVNVKSRGGWGEVQLGALLEEMLAPGQYAKNVATRPGEDARVEYAIRFPGRGEDGVPCWLPIDAKFPLEDYQRLQDAIERADVVAVESSRKSLEDFFKAEARKIRDKYVEPPHTTDFAILFIPTEGLYAEALSRPGLADGLQRDCRVMLAGPANLMAFLNSLQLGFRTLAIEQRSTEVWRVLGAVKTEFGKFGELLAKTKERLDQVGKTLDEAGRKSTTIAKRLRDVEALPQLEAERVLSGEAEVVEDKIEPDLLTRLDVDRPSSH